jgi:hypothetical protein
MRGFRFEPHNSPSPPSLPHTWTVSKSHSAQTRCTHPNPESTKPNNYSPISDANPLHLTVLRREESLITYSENLLENF